MASGYRRKVISTAGTATRTGAAVTNQLIRPAGARPSTRKLTRPATASRQAAASAVRRRSAGAENRALLVSPDTAGAGLTARSPGAPLRYHQAAISGGPASPAMSVTAASTRLSIADPPEPVIVPGKSLLARTTPTAAPGTAATAAPPSTSIATWRTDAPRARKLASSPSRPVTIIRAASKITAAPSRIRLTNTSSGTVRTAACVARNSASVPVSGEPTVSAVAEEPRSALIATGSLPVVTARPSYSAWAWSAVTVLTATGYSHCS